MNYLSHYYFDQATHDSYYIVGIALPDLSKGFKRDWNIHPHKVKGLFSGDKALESIYAGWEKHLQVDKLFHSSNYFRENTKAIKSLLLQINFHDKPIRHYILAHILLELLLDSLLINQGMVQTESYYKHLKTVDKSKITAFIALNGIRDAASFEYFYEKFIEINYLSNYTHTENLAYALNRISYRIWQVEFSEEEHRLMITCINNCYNLIAGNYMFIFDEISEALKSPRNSV